MKYKIAYAKTASELEVEVNGLIEQGWQLMGGISATSVIDDLTLTGSPDWGYSSMVYIKSQFYQAMIYGPAPKPPVSP